MTEDSGDKTTRNIGHIARCACAFTLIVLGTWALNAFIFPVYDRYSMNLRDISIAINGVFFAILAIIANRTLKPFVSKWFPRLAILCIVLAILTFIVGLWLDSAPLVIIAAFLNPLGSSLVFVLVCVACMDLQHRDVGVVVALGIVIAFLLRYPIYLIPVSVVPIFATLLRLVIPFIIIPDIQRNLIELSKGDHIRDAQLAQPRSFLPFGSQIFICMFIFRFMFGVALTYNEIGRVPIDAGFEIIPILIAVLYLFIRRRRNKDCNPDLLFCVAFLFVLAGFLAIPISAGIPQGTANALLYSGSSLFDIVAWYVIIAIGTRNRFGAISVFCWGTAMRSFGVVLGANIGRLLGAGGLNEMSQSIYVAIVILVFVGYISYFLSHQRFADVISSISPVVKLTAPASQLAGDSDASSPTVDTTTLSEPEGDAPKDTFHERCMEVASRYDLTPREADVFELLARGRNGHYIQDYLTVSYNTVKTHVMHIYTKLDIHTQQELIDLVG